MSDSIDRALEAALADRLCIGQIVVRRANGDFILSHRDEEGRHDLQIFRSAEDAIEIARYDDAGNYRPLKTAPNLRHGWRLEVVDLTAVRRALDYFYPGRLAIFAAWKENRLATTPLRGTLDRQSGMYRVAAKISEEQIDEVVANFCRSDGGCLRTILWRRDKHGTIPSTKLPAEKFQPAHDQTGRGEPTVPLLCQETCNLLVAECRKAVKTESESDL
jgi:sirohydrochlorin cobaltochelatase